jgi:hypothetical protein
VVSDRSHHHVEQMTLARDPAGLADASPVLSVKDSILSLTHAASLNFMQPSCLGLAPLPPASEFAPSSLTFLRCSISALSPPYAMPSSGRDVSVTRVGCTLRNR